MSNVTVNGHTQLWNTISNYDGYGSANFGSTIMALDDVVMIEHGTYKAGLYADDDTLCWLDDLHGTLQCTTLLECELDGGGERRVMRVSDSVGGVLRVVGLKLTNADGYSGGGMYIDGGRVELAMCAIENNKAYHVSDMLVRTSLALLTHLLSLLRLGGAVHY